MKILLFGKNGQIGWELNRSLLPLGEVVALGRLEADFSKPECLREIVRTIKPNVIVNAVAYTAVDKAEDDVYAAAVINEVAPSILAEEASRINAILIHYSTDYVFDGAKKSPYVETDLPAPINVYGRTKLGGELAIQSSPSDYIIFRTSWVYASRGNNFLLTILKLAGERDELNVVADQIGSPTSAMLIAGVTVLCLQKAMKERHQGDFCSSLYHLSSSGKTSWQGFAEEIINVATKTTKLQLKPHHINKIQTVQYPTTAKRPMNSRLQLDKIENYFGLRMPHWKSSQSGQKRASFRGGA